MTESTCKVFNIGTVSKRHSYILRFLNADFNKIRRNVCRSIAHSCPIVSALIVAALRSASFSLNKFKTKNCSIENTSACYIEEQVHRNSHCYCMYEYDYRRQMLCIPH